MVTSSRLRERLLAMRGQRVAVLRLQLADVLVEPIDRAELSDEVDGALLADAGHAGHVVARVADEREHVHHLRRLHAELLGDACVIEPGTVLARVVHLDATADELEEVLVDRHDRDVEPSRFGAPRHGADDVVGLDSRGR